MADLWDITNQESAHATLHSTRTALVVCGFWSVMGEFLAVWGNLFRLSLANNRIIVIEDKALTGLHRVSEVF